MVIYCSSVCVISHSVMSNSLQPHGLYPARLLCSWDSPSKNTGVGSHSLLQGLFLTQGSNPGLLWILYHLSQKSWHLFKKIKIEAGGCGLVAMSCLALATPWTIACQATLAMGFPRQTYRSGLLFPSPGDIVDPGIEPGSPVLQANSLPSEPPGKWEVIIS